MGLDQNSFFLPFLPLIRFLSAVKVSRDAKDGVIDRLQNQVAAARAHAAAQTAAAATTAAAHRHLQQRVRELQGHGDRSVAALSAENEDLRRKLKGLRAEVAATRTASSVETVRACSSTARLASEKQVWFEWIATCVYLSFSLYGLFSPHARNCVSGCRWPSGRQPHSPRVSCGCRVRRRR